ncbi:MAG: FAD-binding protein [Gammaproteobacteria bacterium]|nr:FAD-binding protein [Gammaproteobacteria bacterium]
MSFPAALARELESLLGRERFRTDPADRAVYAYDNSRRRGQAGAVAFPLNEAEVADIVRACNTHRWPLIARGLGSNTVGATVPENDALVVSLERMNKIEAVDKANRYVIAEAGATNAAIQEAARKAGFFWPPDPTSAAYSTLGGNLACNAAGPHAVKYATPRENILGLTAVTGTGEIIRVGTRTTKGVVGYDFTRLLLGSEGTLAIITRATLKLWPLPEAVATLRACYANVDAAAGAVSRIMAQPDLPWVLEFMDAEAVGLIRNRGVELPEGTESLLLLEVEASRDGLEGAVKRLGETVKGEGLVAFEAAKDKEEAALLWQARKALSPSLRTLRAGKINEDVVVPVAEIPALVARLGELAEAADIPIVSFGHAGNGNLHVNLLFDPDDERETRAAKDTLPQVFKAVLELGGTLSGEHGVGTAKRDYVELELGPEVLQLMREVKRVFDPNGILNPGKTLPPS